MAVPPNKALDGGILEAFGRLFKNDLKMYVYPLLEKETGELVTVENLTVSRRLRHLYAHLTANRHIVGIDRYTTDYLTIFSREILGKIRKGQSGWEKCLPQKVAQTIKKKQLFGYKPKPRK